jgi:UDP-glucose 4-epimerase
VTGAINIGSGESRTVKDIVNAIGEKLDRSELIRFGELPLQENDPPMILADITRLRSELGWHPHHNLDIALTKTIAWWQHQLDGENK